MEPKYVVPVPKKLNYTEQLPENDAKEQQKVREQHIDKAQDLPQEGNEEPTKQGV